MRWSLEFEFIPRNAQPELTKGHSASQGVRQAPD
jgi:hypothetical protein